MRGESLLFDFKGDWRDDGVEGRSWWFVAYGWLGWGMELSVRCEMGWVCERLCEAVLVTGLCE